MNPDQRLPHFIIIGAMKSATSTLHDQLSRQPGIFMSEPKEPNFFSDDDVYARGMSWYTDLSARAAPDALRGESSTHYTKLPTHPHTVQRLRAVLPAPRLVYVMRHPVDRLVSHYIHEWTMGKINCPIDEAVDQYPELVAYSNYSAQLEPYFEAFGAESVLPLFFDRLTKEPQAELSRVCRFVGYPSTPTWHAAAGARNVSSQRLRRFPLHDVLVDAAVAQKIRRTLVPQRLREWAKGKLTMQQRPVLSAPVQAKLQSVFDADLARLGSWLDTPLDCANFKAVTSDQVLDWSRRDTTAVCMP